MAATVVSVVIFLCGVLVGRGVRAERSAADTATATATADTTPQVPASAPAPVPPGSDPTAAPPPDDTNLSYFERLEKQNAPAEQLKPADKATDRAAERSAKATAAAERPAPPPAKAASRAAAPAESPAAAAGYAGQIAALNVRSEADAIAKRLNSKGYAAYVLAPASGTPSVYRVRVGKFNSRHDAEVVAAKLQKEEQFKPWITR